MESNATESYKSDPSSLTTAQLLREVGSLREFLLSRIETIEKAVNKSHEDLVRVPTDVQEAVEKLNELFSSKLENQKELILQRLDLTEKYRVEQKTDASIALAAALNAAKEAVSEQNASNSIAISKSETAITKQIDQLALMITTTSNSGDGKINDVKDRIGKLEAILTKVQGEGTGKQDSVKGTWTTVGGIIGIIAILISLLTVYITMSK